MTQPAARKKFKQPSLTALISMPVGVDLIRFEKNLLQMGFFGAHDTRHNRQSTRRIEQFVNRDGQKLKVAAEFRASQELGLPSTSDRDKYVAFMRIAMEQKAKHGTLMNPIRFSGYHLLKELGLSTAGTNYEDINRWGQRMADTTITSEQVLYLASRKRYANKTVHVFRSFTRAGEASEDGSGRIEAFEVVLEDWLLENLNQGYVVPEDFNAYRLLKRATAKGIFGYLHLWFHASQGRPIEKDYCELCMLLNIPSYRHMSKISDTIGRSLDELKSIGYVQTWDIRPMTSKDGYKLVLEPGEEVLRVLALSQRKQLPEESINAPLNSAEQDALNALTERGVSPMKGSALVRRFDPETILDQIEYCEFLLSRDKRGKIQNPAGFIIYSIENKVPVPVNFETSRKIKLSSFAGVGRGQCKQSYESYIEQAVDEAVAQRFPGEELKLQIRSVVNQCQEDGMFVNVPTVQQSFLAERLIWNQVKETTNLPSFEEWSKLQSQMPLF